MKKIAIVCLAIMGLLAPQISSAEESAKLISTATFPDISLKSASNASVANSVSDDAGVLLGGIGSDLYHVPGDDPSVFYVITDRGPNNDTVQPDKSSGTGFVVPTFSPMILKVKVTGENVEILDSMAIRTKDGAGVTGLPNVIGYDPVSTDVLGITSSALYNLAGQDSEGIVKTKSGDFWIVDEYAPSLTQLSASGVVKTRFLPVNWAGDPKNYKAVKSIPEIYLKRQANRGFEALAMTPDGRTLFIGLQSPLRNPTKAVGAVSLATRILRFDIGSKNFTGEFVFGFQPVGQVDSTATKNSNLKLSAMVALDADTLLIQERTDNSFLLSTFKIVESANILNTKWDLAATSPSLESYTGAGTNSEIEALIALSNKKVIFNSTSISTMPMKIEGVAVLDANHIVVVNDNDFNFAYNATKAIVENGTNKTKFLTIKLAEALPNYPEGSLAYLGKRCLTNGLTSGSLTCKGTAKFPELRWRN